MIRHVSGSQRSEAKRSANEAVLTIRSGPHIYTAGFSGRGLDQPIDVYHDIEHKLRQAILDHGGSLSHHHGVGKVRQDFMDQVQSDNSIEVLQKTKEAMDPNNTFAIRNGIFTDENLN